MYTGDASIITNMIDGPARDHLAALSKQLRADRRYVDIETMPDVRVELRYASLDNFLGRDLYGPFKGCFLHREAAVMLERAARHLRELAPEWRLVVFDALRPRSVQRVMWSALEGTPEQEYLADPEIGSVHNFGMAVDLSLEQRSGDGRKADMGTEFDSFEAASRPTLEREMLRSGRLNRSQIRNRLILRRVMTGAGFIQLPHEWWHYNARPAEEVREQYRIID